MCKRPFIYELYTWSSDLTADFAFWFGYKDVVIFHVDNGSSVHTDNTKKRYLKSWWMTLNQGFDDTMIVAELQVNVSSSRNKCCFNLHYSGKDRFFVS